MAGTALCADFVAGTALCEPRGADFVAGTALCEPPCADFVVGAALCEPPCWLLRFRSIGRFQLVLSKNIAARRISLPHALFL